MFMNQAAALISMGFLLGVDTFLAFIQLQYKYLIVRGLSVFEEGALNAFYIAVIYSASVFINTITEWGIGILYFTSAPRKKLFWLLFLVNALSIGIGVFGLLIYEHWFEVVKIKSPVWQTNIK